MVTNNSPRTRLATTRHRAVVGTPIAAGQSAMTAGRAAAVARTGRLDRLFRRMDVVARGRPRCGCRDVPDLGPSRPAGRNASQTRIRCSEHRRPAARDGQARRSGGFGRDSVGVPELETLRLSRSRRQRGAVEGAPRSPRRACSPVGAGFSVVRGMYAVGIRPTHWGSPCRIRVPVNNSAPFEH